MNDWLRGGGEEETGMKFEQKKCEHQNNDEGNRSVESRDFDGFHFPLFRAYSFLALSEIESLLIFTMSKQIF